MLMIEPRILLKGNSIFLYIEFYESTLLIFSVWELFDSILRFRPHKNIILLSKLSQFFFLEFRDSEDPSLKWGNKNN